MGRDRGEGWSPQTPSTSSARSESWASSARTRPRGPVLTRFCEGLALVSSRMGPSPGVPAGCPSVWGEREQVSGWAGVPVPRRVCALNRTLLGAGNISWVGRAGLSSM